MKNFLKTISSLLIALIILGGIMFLPDTNLAIIEKKINHITQITNIKNESLSFLLQKILTSGFFFLLATLLTIVAHIGLTKTKKEEENQ